MTAGRRFDASGRRIFELEVPLKYRDVPKRERQSLVGIARAVIAGPQVILADEPTGNLHSDQPREIMELFREPIGPERRSSR